MYKLPQVILYAILAFNLTMFSLMLQMDLLIFNATIYKVISWVVTIAAWVLTYKKRHKYFNLF